VQLLLPFIRSASGKSLVVLMFATITFPFRLACDNSFPYSLIVDCKVIVANRGNEVGGGVTEKLKF